MPPLRWARQVREPRAIWPRKVPPPARSQRGQSPSGMTALCAKPPFVMARQTTLHHRSNQTRNRHGWRCPAERKLRLGVRQYGERYLWFESISLQQPLPSSGAPPLERLGVNLTKRTRPVDRGRVARPRLEVADVFRAHGAAWLQRVLTTVQGQRRHCARNQRLPPHPPLRPVRRRGSSAVEAIGESLEELPVLCGKAVGKLRNLHLALRYLLDSGGVFLRRSMSSSRTFARGWSLFVNLVSDEVALLIEMVVDLSMN